MPPYLLRRLLVAGVSTFVCLGAAVGFTGPRIAPLPTSTQSEQITATAEKSPRRKGKSSDDRALKIAEILTRLNELEAPAKAENPGLAIDDRTVRLDPVTQPLLVEYHGLLKELESLGEERDADVGELAPVTSVEIEPNDTAAAATPLDLGTQPAAIVNGAITPSNDDDYYSFTAPAGSTVWAIVDTGSPPAATGTSRDSILTLFSTDGATTIEVDDDDGTGNGCDSNIESTLSSIIAGRTIASAGTYYLRVEAFSTGTIIPYRLYVVVTTATATAEVESNDSTGTANPLLTYGSTVGLGSGTIGSASDEDFFSFQVKANDIVFIAVDGDPERDGTSTNVDFQLRNSSSAANLINVDSSSNSGGFTAEGICYAIAETGTYYVAVTGRGNSTGSYRVLVVDTDGENVPCTITCPGDVSVSNDAGQCGAVVNYPAPTADELCGTVTCSPASGTLFPIGTTTVTCSTTAGPSCSFSVTVNDTEMPTIACPADMTVTADGEGCSAVVTYATPAVSDNCSGSGTAVCTPESGSVFPAGTTTVTCTATDASGNMGSCSFTVTVSDTTPPTIDCPENVTVTNTPGQCGATVTYPAPTASDDCSEVGTPVCTPASGSFFPAGTTTVTCTVADASGNMDSCSFTVTVDDTEAPAITCPADVTVGNTAGQCGANVTYPAPTVSDNCVGMTTVVCSPASGTFFPVGMTSVTCTATDPAGNTASCGFTVTVTDTQAPAIACPTNIAVTGDQLEGCSLAAVVTYPAPTVSDNCGVASVVCSPASGSVFTQGTTTVTCTVTDTSGNASACAFTVTVGGGFGVCAVDDMTGDRFSQIVDRTSPLYGYWQYRIAATGEILCGVANYVAYIPGRSLTTYDNDDPRCFMNANLNLTGAGTVRVVDHEPNRQFNLRDRNLRNNGPCN